MFVYSLPSPFLSLFDGQREQTLDDEQTNRNAQVPIDGIFFIPCHLPNGHKTMCTKQDTRNNRLNCGY